jgi:hypothetical protein
MTMVFPTLVFLSSVCYGGKEIFFWPPSNITLLQLVGMRFIASDYSAAGIASISNAFISTTVFLLLDTVIRTSYVISLDIFRDG